VPSRRRSSLDAELADRFPDPPVLGALRVGDPACRGEPLPAGRSARFRCPGYGMNELWLEGYVGGAACPLSQCDRRAGPGASGRRLTAPGLADISSGHWRGWRDLG
jgi:hypothetical protein